jgi:ATPase subunit of ABC transporter with duplicated ATPase domains
MAELKGFNTRCRWILDLDRVHGIQWKGNFSSWMGQKEPRLEQENKQIDAHMKSMKQVLEWGRQNPKASRFCTFEGQTKDNHPVLQRVT